MKLSVTIYKFEHQYIIAVNTQTNKQANIKKKKNIIDNLSKNQ